MISVKCIQLIEVIHWQKSITKFIPVRNQNDYTNLFWLTIIIKVHKNERAYFYRI